MDILELKEIPRERDKLRGIIGEARYERRKSQIIRWIAYAMVIVAVMILLYNSGGSANGSILHTIYIPVVR